jgi:hypothetical protein
MGGVAALKIHRESEAISSIAPTHYGKEPLQLEPYKDLEK